MARNVKSVKKSAICPKCKRSYNFLYGHNCPRKGWHFNPQPGDPPTPDELPDIGVVICPINDWDIELRICYMRRKAAMHYAKTNKPYQMWQCATCEHGKNAVQKIREARAHENPDATITPNKRKAA